MGLPCNYPPKTEESVSIGGPVSASVSLALSCTVNCPILWALPPLTGREPPSAAPMIPDSQLVSGIVLPAGMG
ncbi:hypothetical protein V6N13_042053 [Hibiscus sabdariffa]